VVGKFSRVDPMGKKLKNWKKLQLTGSFFPLVYSFWPLLITSKNISVHFNREFNYFAIISFYQIQLCGDREIHQSAFLTFTEKSRAIFTLRLQ
jgi:hypothetical protein